MCVLKYMGDNLICLQTKQQNGKTEIEVQKEGKFTEVAFTAVRTDVNDTYYCILDGGKVETLFITEKGITTPAVSAAISSNTNITVTVANAATISGEGGTLTYSATVTGGAAIASGAGTANMVLSGAGCSGYVTVKVTNTVANIGSTYAEYVLPYSIPAGA